jgi:hypothetical protein
MMGDVSQRADRFVQKLFQRTPAPEQRAQEAVIQTRAQQIQAIAQRAIERRKGF